MGKRTDCHRPSEIKPEEYAYELSFSGPTVRGGFEMPPVNLGEARTIYKEEGARIHASLFQCDVCGAHFVYGDLWRHEMTGVVITIGWECAEKYSKAVCREEYFAARNRGWRAAERAAREAAMAEVRERFLAANPGLEEALKTEHDITRDIASRFVVTGELSEPQVNLVFKLARETKERAAREAEEAEKLAPVPTELLNGRVTVRGTILAAMWREGDYGPSLKMIMTVPVEGERYFKVWSTVPACLYGSGESAPKSSELAGCEVEFAAKLERSNRDECFAFAKRPTKARLISRPEPAAEV